MQDFFSARKVFGEDFLYEEHVNYLLKLLRKFTSGASIDVAEVHRLSSLFFVVSGLDLLGALDKRLSPADKVDIIEWIYSFQVDIDKVVLVQSLDDIVDQNNPQLPINHRLTNNNQRQQQHSHPNRNTYNVNDTSNNNNTTASNSNNSNNNDNHDEDEMFRSNNHRRRVGHSGFRATSMIDSDIPMDCGAITMTYCALASLVILGDDLSRVDRKSIIEGMKDLQLPDGSFKPSILGGESDMRLVYCAVAVCKLLDDWSGLDKDRCATFIRNSLSFEGAFSQCPGAEAHGGSTYCALASLKLMSKVDDVLTGPDTDRLIRWCMNRFDRGGFSGRPNKDQDTCYSFWIGACLRILNHFTFIEQKELLDFMLRAQEEKGGLSKVPTFYSDPLHTYLGFAGLTFLDDELCACRNIHLLKLDPTLNISLRARLYLEDLHKKWKAAHQQSATSNGNGNITGDCLA